MATTKDARMLIPLPSDRVAGTDDVDAETVKLLRTARAGILARSLGVQVPGGPDGEPQPTSTRDLLDMTGGLIKASTELVDVHKEATDLERERRVEAEQRAGGAYEAGEKEAGEKWGVIMQVVQSTNTTMLEMMRTQHEQGLATQRQLFEAQMQGLEHRLALQMAQIQSDQQRALADRDREVARLQTEAETERTRLRLEHDKDLALVAKDHELTLAKMPHGGGPERLYYEAYYQSQGKLAAAQTDAQIMEMSAKAEEARKRLDLYDWLRDKGDDILKLGMGAVGQLQQAPAPGLPRNGIEATPPPVAEAWQ